MKTIKEDTLAVWNNRVKKLTLKGNFANLLIEEKAIQDRKGFHSLGLENLNLNITYTLHSQHIKFTKTHNVFIKQSQGYRALNMKNKPAVQATGADPS